MTAGGDTRAADPGPRREEIAAGLRRVEDRIARACASAGRASEEVTLVVVTKYFPADGRTLESVECQYETLPGWSESSVGLTRHEDLPVNARRYLERIEQVTGVPIHMVSTSPDRDHTILLHHPYAA